jgi:hypothetical protein
MHSVKRLWALLALLLVVVALPAAQPATASGSNAMAIDAIPGGGIDASVGVTGTAPFDVDIVVTEASTPYQGYQDKLAFDSSVVNADAVTQLKPADMTTCGVPAVNINNSDNSLPGYTGAAYDVGCAKLSPGGVTYTGPVTTVTLHCVGNGTSALHLVTLVEDPDYGTSTVDASGSVIDTGLTDASVTCGEGGPAPTATPPGATGSPAPTPAGPAATPTPLPPGYEAVDLAAGCNPVATTYPDATTIETIAAAVGPAGNLDALWEFEGGVWLGYSPAYPQVSDLTEKNFLDVVFVCVLGPGSFVRPTV